MQIDKGGKSEFLGYNVKMPRRAALAWAPGKNVRPQAPPGPQGAGGALGAGTSARVPRAAVAFCAILL